MLVIFDLDGTLTDSAPGVVASFSYALRQAGVELPDGDLAARFVGPPMPDVLAALGLGTQADAVIAAYRADYAARGWAMNTVFDGIEPLLADLRAAGVRLAVATCKLESMAARILAHFGLEQYFDVIAGANADGPHGARSSKAEVLAHVLEQLQPVPDRVRMVGDRWHDVEGAAAHGIHTVVVDWGYGQADFVGERQRAGTHVATVDELRRVLGV